MLLKAEAVSSQAKARPEQHYSSTSTPSNASTTTDKSLKSDQATLAMLADESSPDSEADESW